VMCVHLMSFTKQDIKIRGACQMRNRNQNMIKWSISDKY